MTLDLQCIQKLVKLGFVISCFVFGEETAFMPLCTKPFNIIAETTLALDQTQCEILHTLTLVGTAAGLASQTMVVQRVGNAIHWIHCYSDIYKH